MSELSLEKIFAALPGFEVNELDLLEAALRAVRETKKSTRLSSDSPTGEDSDSEGLGLNGWAQKILEDEAAYELTLADQALLASLILTEVYQQDVFSSRDINNVIEESGRPRVAHITSAISGLTGRNFLTGEKKDMRLSTEGRAKARGLIGMLRRRLEAA